MARYIKDWFTWGMSEDDVLWWPDKYLFSNWIDVSWNSNFIQLDNAPTEAIDTWTQVPKAFLGLYDKITNSSKVLAFTDAWVYRTWTVWTVDSNIWITANFVIWDNVYLVQNNWATSTYTLYTETIATAIASSWTTSLVATTWALSTSENDWYTWVTVLWDIAYIWLGDKVCRFEPTTADTVTEYDIFWDEIVFISYVWGYFRVYTKTWKLMLWDWNSDVISESIDLKLPLEAWYQIWNIDYLYSWLVGLQKGLYYMSWYDLVPLFKNRDSEQLWEQKFVFSYLNDQSPMANYWPTLFGHTDNSWDERLYEFGKDVEWLPEAYKELPKYSSYGLEYTQIRWLYVSEDYLYYGFNDWTNKWVDYINVSNKNANKTKEWAIITNVNPLWAWLYKKTAKYIYFKVWDIDADRTIEVQISYDWWAYTSLGTINEQPLDNIARLPVQWDFRDYSIKFILATTLTTPTSPKIYYWYAFDYEEHDI
jgi:hypothetical protein